MRDTIVLPLAAMETFVPLFFFTILGDSMPDIVGIEFASADAARREAIWTAGQILSDDTTEFHDRTPWVMRVTDDKGGLVCNLQFSMISGGPTV